jgi:adenylate kinase family enzyme
MYKIGICGSHGTGKTTLAGMIAAEKKLNLLTGLMRSFWTEFGVSDFEKLPKDVRTTFQKESLMRQITAEDRLENFVTDRTVLDQLAYTKMSSNMSDSSIDFLLYEQLCGERLNQYTHIFYLPVEFEVEPEFLRADISTRHDLAVIMKEYLDKWYAGKYITISGPLEKRLEIVKEVLKS